MTILQEAAHAATQSAVEGAHGAWHSGNAAWILLLPLIGFVINGIAALAAARRSLPRVPPVGDPHWDAHGHEPGEGEGMDHGVDAHPADHTHDDHHDAHAPTAARGWTHTLPSIVAPGVMIAAFALAVMNFLAMRGEHAFEATRYFTWMQVGKLNVDVALLLDPLSIVMTLIITGVGSLIHIFSIGYMKEDPGYPRYMAYLNLFVFFMLVLVLGASYPLMFVGWEGVGLASYLLIGFWFKEKANADAGKKAFIANRVGDFGFLMAMFLLFAHVGSLNFSGPDSVFARAAADPALAYGGAAVTLICLFFFLGATGKSAQIPLYVWLPDAMAGPTPVSALIHAATMVTAGVYLVVRSSVLFAMAPTASLVVALVGALTAIFAASIGLKQWDIKKVLAYSTVSQLGFMFAAVGMGAYTAGVFHLMTHAFFKACLFLGSGAVIHAMHAALHATHNPADAQDMRNMGGLRKYLPITFVTMGIATLAISGVPPFAGFFSKDEIIGAAWIGAEGHSALSQGSLFGISGAAWMGFIGGTLSIAAFMTAFYMGRMMIYTFWGGFRSGDQEERHLHEGDWTLTVPLIVLAALSTLGGFVNVEAEVPIVRSLNWLGFGEGLHHWLHPVLAGSEAVLKTQGPAVAAAGHHSEWPIILAILIGLGGLLTAWLLLGRKVLGTAEAEPAYRGGLERQLYNKWFVDEIYDRTVLAFVRSTAAVFRWIDENVIDSLVNFTGRMSQAMGLLLGHAQTGQTNTYAFVLVLGVLLLLGVFAL
ncbi:MAG TPA: NADH-quinone oxidoreductase subunit L [Longimicrobium sp.]|nr:NADH-quinone oxidoreductase subunit L [Longimicrobium sp.]